MTKKLIIFDLDGTLLDTIMDLAAAVDYTLRVMDMPLHTLMQYQGMVGGGISKLLERAMPENMRSKENILEARSIFMPYYYENIYVHTKPYEGISELLQNLRKEGFLLAVASNKFQSGVDRLIQHFFPLFDFVGVLGSESAFKLKPDPHMIIHLAQLAGVSLQNVCMVGDSMVDYRTAQAAGVRSILVSWGFVGRKALEESTTSKIVDSPEEILQSCLTW
ncbi:MAG: HAD-IA family hydrolase [Alistipes sp.]|nr:HAD-IA family hydrolase [Candidatus Alistipes equi]